MIGQAAAALDRFRGWTLNYVRDEIPLATLRLLHADVCDDPLLPVHGVLPVRRVDVSEQRLAEVEIDPAAWQARLAAARAAWEQVEREPGP